MTAVVTRLCSILLSLALGAAVVPAGTPPDVVAKINAELARVLKLQDVHDKLTQQGLYPVGSSAEQFGAHIRSEMARYAKVVKEAGIRAD